MGCRGPILPFFFGLAMLVRASACSFVPRKSPGQNVNHIQHHLFLTSKKSIMRDSCIAFQRTFSYFVFFFSFCFVVVRKIFGRDVERASRDESE